MRKTKCSLCILIVSVFLVVYPIQLCYAADSYTPGDANADKVIDLIDVLLISRSCAGWDITIDTFNADCNCDNEVNLKDVVLIKRHLAGGWNIVLGEATLTFDAMTNGGKFIDGNGFNADSNKRIAPGNTYGLEDADGKRWPSNPKKYGCSFKGWYTQPTGGMKITETTAYKTKGNVTLYAQFGGYMETPEIGI